MKTDKNYKPRMTDEQKAELIERFADTRTEVLAKEMGVNYRSLCRWAASLGLKKSKDFRQGMSAIAKVGFRARYGNDGYKSGHVLLDDEKKEYMRAHFATIPNIVLAKALNVNDRTIRRWAKSMGLTKNREVIEMHRRCRMLPTPEEWFRIVAIIRELYPDGRDDEAVQLTGYSKASIYRIAVMYGFKRSEAYVQAVKQANTGKSKYSPELIAAIAEYFPTHTDRECAEKFGLSKHAIQDIARRNGMYKAADHLDKIHLSNITAAHKANTRKPMPGDSPLTEL